MVVVFQQGAGLWHSVNRTAGYFLCWAFSALVGTKREKKHFIWFVFPDILQFNPLVVSALFSLRQ